MTSCPHGWSEVSRRFTQWDDSSFTGPQAMIERAHHGFTTIEQRCFRCSKVEFRVALGDQRPNVA